MKSVIKVRLITDMNWIFITSRKLTQDEKMDIEYIISQNPFKTGKDTYPELYQSIRDYLIDRKINISNKYRYEYFSQWRKNDC